jgi:hypothetical protein
LLSGKLFLPGHDDQEQLVRIMMVMGSPSAAKLQKMMNENVSGFFCVICHGCGDLYSFSLT